MHGAKLMAIALTLMLLALSGGAAAQNTPLSARTSPVPAEKIYDPGQLKARDSMLKVHVGEKAPDFRLKDTNGHWVRLADFKELTYVVLSFVPAAWTPVCSAQWPAYNLAQEEIQNRNATVIGITVDNVPTLSAWTKEMGGCWFPVLSDFYPHGQVAAKFGVLRTDGTTERAIFVIDRQGVIRAIDVYDINTMPRVEELIQVLDKIIAEDAARK